MSRLQEKYQREYAENLAYQKAELYHEHLLEIEKQQEIDECEGTLIAYMGLDEFKKLSNDNISNIVGAMREYAETFQNK